LDSSVRFCTESVKNTSIPTIAFVVAAWILSGLSLWSQPQLRFQAQTPQAARQWQQAARAKLYALMMGGAQPERVPLDPKVIQRVEVAADATVLEELTLQTLPDRRAHVWLARPARPTGKVGAVLAINGHGGSGEQVIRGQGLYWYGRALSQMGYVVIAPDVGQHELQHTNWSLMGERTWDALRCVDYLLTRPEVDPARLAVAGLSLGGETTMYVAALDERLRIACSSGWLTTVANMKNGHCPCFNFAGLEENFDFSDIFACVAPRQLVCELGEQERAPGGFPVAIGRSALSDLERAYRVFGAASNLTLTVHPGPHVFVGRDFLPQARAALGAAARPLPEDGAAAAWCRFAEGPEALDGTPYYWLARERLRLELEVRPEPGDSLELSWGSKSDERDALILVNGKSIPVRGGGHWGFRWVRVPLPHEEQGRRYDIELRPGLERAAFLSEVRLARAQPARKAPDLSRTSYKAKITVMSGNTNAPAFPEMSRFWQEPISPPSALRKDKERAALFRQAEANARLANQAFFRCRRYVDGWLAQADPASGLIPRNLSQSRDFWNGRDSAADNYPFMVLTASMIDRPLMDGRLLDMLRTETRLTSRLDRLPDDYSFSKKGWRRERLELDAIIFDGAEYVKDGLLPITEWLGPSPWSERMVGIMDDIWKHAEIETPFGKIPTTNFEVCGDLLQSCSRLYWFTGERKYLDWGTRLGDYFLLGTNHPTRHLKQLRLIDHGCEVINGLSELYVTVAHASPEKRSTYRQPIHELFDCILQKARNEHGLLYTSFNPQTGEHSNDLCDTWGYDYDGFYTMWLVDKEPAYRDAVRQALSHLVGNYVGACWADRSADGFADSIEGAINLFNREPVAPAADWIDSQTRLMWAIQKPDGIIEGWHGDGNFARTSLMYALWKTQGVTVEPWRPDLRFGAVQNGASGKLFLLVTAEKQWDGLVRFDQPRHRVHMRLPLDYARINQFPEWFTVKPGVTYPVAVNGARPRSTPAAELVGGFPLRLRPGQTSWLEVQSP
jgi:dienelactone hydrolase